MKMKNKKEKKEDEKQKQKMKCAEGEDEGKQSENEDEDADGAGSDDGQHDDKDKDVALIKKMISDHLGDKADGLSKKEMEQLHALGKEAYQAHKEMLQTEGKDGKDMEDEAFKHAGHAMKLAHHMAAKAKEDESETESEDEDNQQPAPKKKAAPAKDDSGSSDDDDDDEDDASSENEDESESEDEKKESKRVNSLKTKLLEAEGRIAALEAKTRQAELGGYIEKCLRESKQPNVITKRFREAAGKFRSKADFDSKWKIFTEAIKGTRPEVDWGLMMEKSTSSDVSSDSRETKGFDFSNCAE